MDFTLIPLTADLGQEGWRAVDPAALGIEAEMALVHTDDGDYRPVITIARFPADERLTLTAIADATLADAGPDARLLDREVGDGFVSQVVSLNAGGRELRLAEVALGWHAADPAVADTVVIARLTCLPTQLPEVGAGFQALVSSMAPYAAG